MQQLKKYKSLPVFYLTIILILAAAVRLYGLRNSGFDYDQEYAANFAYSVVKEYPIQMIGQGLSINGLFMGPWYFYFLTPFFLLANLHPIGGYIGSVFLGLITISVYFYIFKSIFGLRAAIIASLLRAFLFSFISTDLSMTPAFSADLPALITWFLLYKIWNDKLNYAIALSFLFGLYTSYHPILFPFYLVFIVILVLKKRIPGWKIIICSIVAFLIPLAPLLRFEYYHNFLEVKKLLSVGSEDTNQIRNLSRLEDILGISFINPINTFFGIYAFNFSVLFGRAWGSLIYLPFLILIYLRWNFWKHPFHKIILFSTFFVFIGYYFILPVHMTEYYLLGLNTIFFFYAVGTISQIKNTKVVFCVVILLILVNLHLWFEQNQRINNISVLDKERIVQQIIKNTPANKPFFVSYITKPGFSFGYSYFFKINNRLPSADPQPLTFNIVSPKSLVGDKFDFESGDIGLIFPK